MKAKEDITKYPELQVPQQPPNMFVLVMLAVFLTGFVVCAGGLLEHKLTERDKIGMRLCTNASLNFTSYNPITQQVECSYHITQQTEHLNMSTANYTIYLQPDWAYYEGKNES